MNNVLTFEQASMATGIAVETLKTRVKRGQIPAVRMQRGKRIVLGLSASTVASLLESDKPGQSYEGLVQQWLAEQASGYHSGRPLAERTLETHLRGLGYYWRYLGQQESIRAITPENLRLALSRVPVNYETKECHYTQRHQMYAAVSSFFLFLIRQGLRQEADIKALRDLKPRRIFAARRTVLRQNEWQAVMKHINTGYARSAFDIEQARTIVYVLVYGGLRASEALGVRIQDIDLPNQELTIADGKGHKTRTIGLHPVLAQQLETWLSGHRPVCDHDYVLVVGDGRRMPYNAMRQKITRIAKASGVDITAHGFRRTCATVMAEANIPLVNVKEHLGHVDIHTTMNYILPDKQRARELVKRMGALPEPDPEPTPETQTQKVKRKLSGLEQTAL